MSASWLKSALFLAALAPPAPAQFDLSRTVDQTLAAWQKNTGVRMESDAENLIRRDVGDAWPRLSEMVKLQSAHESSPEPLIRMLLRSYCFDLRDAKIRAGRQTAAAWPLYARGFQTPSPVESLHIETKDVNDYSFLKFLSQFFPRLQAVGYLEVKSKPDRAAITIDKQPKGFTNRVFVVSPGSHSIQIAFTRSSRHCARTVRIESGRQSSAQCP